MSLHEFLTLYFFLHLVLVIVIFELTRHSLDTENAIKEEEGKEEDKPGQAGTKAKRASHNNHTIIVGKSIPTKGRQRRGATGTAHSIPVYLERGPSALEENEEALLIESSASSSAASSHPSSPSVAAFALPSRVGSADGVPTPASTASGSSSSFSSGSAGATTEPGAGLSQNVLLHASRLTGYMFPGGWPRDDSEYEVIGSDGEDEFDGA